MNYEGKLVLNKNHKIAIVIARFNNFITSKLLEGALDAIQRHNGNLENVDTYWVPGSFEIPLLTAKLAKSKKYNGIICLGTVIQGETDHYQFVANSVTKGIANLSLQYDLPIMFGVLTTNDLEQAIQRAGVKSGNKGYEVAVSLIEMINLLQEI